MEIKKIEFTHKDERGSLSQIISGNWKQLNIIETRKDSIRGGHYHRKTREFFYVLKGSINVEILNINAKQVSNFRFKKGDGFIIDPYESHTIKALEDIILVILLSEIHNPQDPDIFQP